MIHARSDYDCIQPWPTKRPPIAKQNGNTVLVPIDEPGWAGTDAAAQLAMGRVQPIIPDDEPVFLIRGQDLAAIPAALAWCEAAHERMRPMRPRDRRRRLVRPGRPHDAA